MQLLSRTWGLLALQVLVYTATAIPAATWECVRTSSRSAAKQSMCGDMKSIDGCLRAIPEGSVQTDVEACYLDAGCGPDEASAAAIDLLVSCVRADDVERSHDLRRRQNSNSDNKGSTANQGDTLNDSSDSNNSDAVQTDAAPAETAKAAAETSDNNDNVETVVVTNTPEQQTTAAPITTSDPGSCLTSKTISTTSCSTTNGDTNCGPTNIVKLVCAEGKFCLMDSQGQTSCMDKQNSLTAGGVVVAIVFSAAIVISMGMMFFFCCKERNQQKKLKAKAEAAAIAKTSGMEGAAKKGVSDRVPLMAAPGGNPQGGPQGYDGHTGQDPFHDQNRY